MAYRRLISAALAAAVMALGSGQALAGKTTLVVGMASADAGKLDPHLTATTPDVAIRIAASGATAAEAAEAAVVAAEVAASAVTIPKLTPVATSRPWCPACAVSCRDSALFASRA